MKYYIGVDIGGTNIAAAIVDKEYKILSKTSIKTNAPRSAESICEDIAKTCNLLCEESGIPYADICGIGAACPGLIKDGVVTLASNLGFCDVPLKEILQQKTNKPCSVCNDANVAALAEYSAGSGKGYHSLAMITIGTGIGGGIVLDGKIWEGFNGAGAEMGHITAVPSGRLCSCGNRGCLETYCSATALINDTKEAMLNHPESKLWEICPTIDSVNGKTVFDAEKLGDTTAQNVIDRFIKYLSIGVTNIITLIQPEVVCIGGGMSAQGDRIIVPLNYSISQNGVIKTLKKRPIITAAHFLNDAGIIGAVADIMKEIAKNEE